VLDVRWTENGVRRRSRTKFASVAAAAKMEMQVRQRVEAGLAPFPEPERAAATVRDVLAAYHELHVPNIRPRSQEVFGNYRRELEGLLGDVEAEKLTYDALLRYRQQRRQDYRRRTKRTLSDVTIKKAFSHLRSALRFAKVNGRIESHVFEKLTKDLRANLLPPEREEDSKGQMIEDEAFEAIAAHLLPIYRPVVRLLRLTGMRKGEVCGLRWSDIQRDRIALPDRPGFKTGRRSVPLTAAMRALLPPRKIDGSALVFEAEGGGSLYQGLGQAWDEARDRAGFPTFRLHDIRHTVATELDQLGDRRALELSLGMKGATVNRYIRHRDFERQSALFDRHQIGHSLGTATIASAVSE
jgi:integrase